MGAIVGGGYEEAEMTATRGAAATMVTAKGIRRARRGRTKDAGKGKSAATMVTAKGIRRAQRGRTVTVTAKGIRRARRGRTRNAGRGKSAATVLPCGRRAGEVVEYWSLEVPNSRSGEEAVAGVEAPADQGAEARVGEMQADQGGGARTREEDDARGAGKRMTRGAGKGRRARTTRETGKRRRRPGDRGTD
ncbi:hypothetical protein Syun_024688 [Stephania yunnanensis]|uniref:Uncharacterized protein n=1 Tax=Stephania yunnanensis TaxID=152371 RepID=A0AAP0EXC0_9MAGN